MKKLFAILLSLILILGLVACAPADEKKPEESKTEKQDTVEKETEKETEKESEEPEAKDSEVAESESEAAEPSEEKKADSEKAPEAEENKPATGKPIDKKDLKIGFIHISDPSDMGYTYNHDKGTQKMIADLGLDKSQVISKFNVPEGSEAETAARELVEQGCQIIFATSFGFEDYVLNVAKEYPEVEFCHATGFKAKQAKEDGINNFHNYFGEIYQARYLSGIVAGLKTKTNKLGYVCAMPFAECISGFDSFYLGAKSVNPDVTMMVMYTMSWNDPTKEAQVAQALIDKGCDVIGQHCDSTAPATKAEAAGVFHVGYNSDMRDAAPKASMTSAVWDWSVYLKYAVTQVMEGKGIATDWSKGLADGVVDISPLNDEIVADGTAEAVEAAREKILKGDWDVFTGPLKDVDGNVVVEEGVTFKEPQSAPSFDKVLEGIEIVE